MRKATLWRNHESIFANFRVQALPVNLYPCSNRFYGKMIKQGGEKMAEEGSQIDTDCITIDGQERLHSEIRLSDTEGAQRSYFYFDFDPLFGRSEGCSRLSFCIRP